MASAAVAPVRARAPAVPNPLRSAPNYSPFPHFPLGRRTVAETAHRPIEAAHGRSSYHGHPFGSPVRRSRRARGQFQHAEK